MTVEELQKKIESLVPQSTVYILDPMQDGQHLQALVISPIFEGMMLIKQHQMIMKPLKETLQSAIHALGLKTFTPAKWQEVKKEYNL